MMRMKRNGSWKEPRLTHETGCEIYDMLLIKTPKYSISLDQAH